MLEDLLERMFIGLQQLSVYFERGVFSTWDSPFPWL